MNDSREAILASIREHLRQGKKISPEQQVELVTRMSQHPRGVIPKRTEISHPELIALFCKQAARVQADIQNVKGLQAIPQIINQYLNQKNQPLKLRIATLPLIQQIHFPADMEIQTGAAEKKDSASLTVCQYGVAETGTLVFASGPATPTTLNYVPLIHIVILPTDKIVGSYEDAWDKIRLLRPLPRAINFITGPSRTADIEQKLLLGVHGPKFLLIILYENEA